MEKIKLSSAIGKMDIINEDAPLPDAAVWHEYERLKAKLRDEHLTPEEFTRRCAELIDQLGL